MAEGKGLARDSAYSTLGILLSGGAQFLISLLIGRIAGPAALGVVRGSISLATTASLLWPSAAGQSASLFVARSIGAGDGLAGSYERHLTRMTAPIVVVLAAGSTIGGRLLLGLTWAEASWVAALVITFSAYQLARGIRFGRGQVARATLWEAAAAAVMVGLLIVVLAAELPTFYLAPLVAGYGLYAAGVWFRPPAGPLPPELHRELRTFVLWGVAGTLASAGLLQLSMVIAAAVAAGEEAGRYAAALSVATPISMVARALSMALFPELARQRGRGDHAATRAITDRVTRGLVITMVPAFGSLILLAEPVLVGLYGPEFRAAVPVLRVLLAAVLLTTVPVAAVNSINVRGPQGVRRSAQFSWAGFTVGMLSIGGLVGAAGIMGVALGYLAGAVVTAALPYVLVWRRDSQPWAGTTLALVVALAAVSVTPLLLELHGWAAALIATAVLLVTWAPPAYLLWRRSGR